MDYLRAMDYLWQSEASDLGDQILPRFADCVVQALNVTGGIVSLEACSERQSSRSLFGCRNCEEICQGELSLRGVPLPDGTANNRVAGCRQGARERWPGVPLFDLLECESYAAAPIMDRAGRPMGHLVVFDTKPFSDMPAMEKALADLAEKARSVVEHAVAMAERTERELALKTLVAISGDQDFFWAACHQMTRIFRCSHATILELTDESGTAARTIAAVVDGIEEATATYLLDGTPCGELVRTPTDFVVYEDDVASKFPLDEFLVNNGIRSYMGCALTVEGRTFGHLVVMNRQPMTGNLEQNRLAMRAIAARIGAEYRLQLAEARLRDERRLADFVGHLQESDLIRSSAGEFPESFTDQIANYFDVPRCVVRGIEIGPPLTLRLRSQSFRDHVPSAPNYQVVGKGPLYQLLMLPRLIRTLPERHDDPSADGEDLLVLIHPETVSGIAINSLVGICRFRGASVGIVSLDTFDVDRTWTATERRHLRTIADLVAQELAICEMDRERLAVGYSLQSAQQVADRVHATSTQLLANVSHELRTPLNGVLGFSQVLMRDSQLADQHRDYVHKIQTSGQHLLLLIDDLMDLSRFETGAAQLCESPFRVRELLDQVFECLLPVAAESDAGLTLEADGQVPSVVLGDGGRLKQMVTSLVENAIHLVRAGSVAVAVTKLDRNREDFCRDTCLEIRVNLRSEGLLAKLKDEVFQPFGQILPKQQTHTSVSSLALALSRRNALLSGGRIEMECGEEKTACFRLLFPCDGVDEDLLRESTDEDADGNDALNTRASAVSDVGTEQRCASALSVLVVDDDPIGREAVGLLLQTHGFQVHSVCGGSQALEFCACSLPDVILMDIRMPGIDGHTATERIKTAYGAEAPAIIALTAGILDSERQAARDAGCDRFLSKPYQAGELIQTIYDLVKLRSAR